MRHLRDMHSLARLGAIWWSVSTTALFDTCSPDDFRHAVWERSSGKPEHKSSAIAKYMKMNATTNCKGIGGIWYPNYDKKLILNLGQGTTGTRWISCVMKQLGFESAHNVLMHGTTKYNRYDYVSDWPVPSNAYELIKSNPNGTFLLSLRDSETWWRMRLHDHPDNTVGQATFCGKTYDISTKAGQSASPAYTVAYEAWVKCLVPQNQLFAFNLWEIKDTAFVKMLVQFLEQRGHSKAKKRFAKSSADEIVEKCHKGPKKDHDKTANFKEMTKNLKALFRSKNQSSDGTNRSSAR